MNTQPTQADTNGRTHRFAGTPAEGNPCPEGRLSQENITDLLDKIHELTRADDGAIGAHAEGFYNGELEANGRHLDSMSVELFEAQLSKVDFVIAKMKRLRDATLLQLNLKRTENAPTTVA